jgi:hypothetical protein
MPTVDELLQKRKGQLEKMSAEPIARPTLLPKKRIERTGATRPWQENLPQYQSPSSSQINAKEGAESGQKGGLKKVEPNLSQSEAKVEPNLGQSEAATAQEVKPKLSQTSKAQFPLLEKVEPQLRPKVEPILSQSEAKVEPIPVLSAVVGLQRNVLVYIYESCRFSGGKISGPISIQNLVNASQSTSSAVRKAAQRLEEKQFVLRVGYKDGRGGWTQYGLPDGVYNALLLDETRAKVEPNLGQSRAKVGTEVEPQLRPKGSSSSSFLNLENLKTTTTELEVNLSDNSALSPEWVSLDIEPLTTIGFTQNHLAQIARQNLLKPEVVQDSIHGFAFDLRVNGKGSALKSGPLNFFMGILKKGIPYAPPENYVTPEEEALKKYLSAKKAQAEKRELLERELQDSEFQEWVRGLDASEKREIAPQAQEGGLLYLGQLRVHFDQVVWPTARLRILLGAGSEAAPN